MRTNTSLIDRFFSVLVREIHSEEPQYLESSFTVAEIYQSLVPYRTHRDLIGAEMNGDYEDALLRLLAGEGGYLTLESDTARERIRLELRSSNPNTGLYREYAAVGVRLVPEKVEQVVEKADVEDLDPDPGAQTELDVDDDELDAMVERTLDASEVSRLTDDLGLDDLLDEVPEQEESTMSKVPAEGPGQVRQEESTGSALQKTSAARSERGKAPSAGSSPKDSPAGSEMGRVETSSSDSNGGDGVSRSPQRLSLDRIPDDVQLEAAPAECPECDEALPPRDGLHFCPFCGANVFVLPCESCGEVLERSWNFCVACGEPAS